MKNFLEFLTEQWRESWLLWFFSLQNLLLELEARLAHLGYCSLVVLVVGGQWFRWGSGIKGCLQFGLLWILWKQTYLIWVLMVIPQSLLFFFALNCIVYLFFVHFFFFFQSGLSFGLKIGTFHPFLYCWYGDFFFDGVYCWVCLISSEFWESRSVRWLVNVSLKFNSAIQLLWINYKWLTVV